MIVSSEQRRSAGTERTYLAPDNERASLFALVFGSWLTFGVLGAHKYRAVCLASAQRIPVPDPGFFREDRNVGIGWVRFPRGSTHSPMEPFTVDFGVFETAVIHLTDR